jgi:gliding motility-associated-like protein
VNVGAPVTPTFTAIPSQCAGSTITLSNSSLEGFTGTWSPAVNNQATTNYTFTPTAGQCATTASMTVSIDVPSQVTFAPVGPFCSGSNFNLPLTSNEGYTGSWSPAINNQTTTDYTFNVDPGQCALNGLITVTISSNPTIDITNVILSNESCNQMDGSISGIAINNGTPNFNYQWNNNPSLNTIDLQGLTAGTYALEVTDQLGCTATASVVIDENQAPTIDASGIVVEQPTCLQGGQINGLLVNGNGPFDYQWTNSAQTTLSINNLTDGNYSLLVTDVNGCTVNYGPVAIVTPAGPTVAFTWSPVEPNVENEVSFINNSNTSSGLFSSEWYISDSTFSTLNANFIYFLEGEYPVTLVITDDVTGCVDSLTQFITIFGEMTIPNVITMNNDQINDEFFIKGLKENSYLVILNRWGNVVFETQNYQNDWNGIDIVSGNPVADGVYTYLIKSIDGSQKHGFIHVTR